MARCGRGAPNPTVQPSGASRSAQRQIERRRRLAPVADLVVSVPDAMKLTRHRFRFGLGLLTCAVGLMFFFAPGLPAYRIADGVAWLLIGCLLCFVQEFHLKFTRDWFTLGLGVLIAVAGLLLTLVAAGEFVGPRAHGWLRFYELIGIGPILLTTGVLVGFSKNAR